jgi:GT2 family glycosyltransferase
MPFAGDAAAADAAVRALLALDTQPGDELILVDNADAAPAANAASATPAVTVIAAPGERSPAHARNLGAAHARSDWILFLDADTRPPPGLLDLYFAQEIAEDAGAVVGEVIAAPGAGTLAGRYGAARSFLGQQAHLEHPYRPRAAAANLLVRRLAFERVGGFYEGVRAAEDTDFSWRLQEAGWRLQPRAQAQVEHDYRATVSELRRQWRGYAAGRAWLARRYEGFEPEPGLLRALRRVAARVRGARPGRGPASPVDTRDAAASGQRRGGPALDAGRLERGRYLALDALLSLEELVGFTLSNRPALAGAHPELAAEVVLVADRFPAQGDPLTELAGALDRARVEALARPEALDPEAGRRLAVSYLEDDGAAARTTALLVIALRHPLRCAIDLARREPGAVPLRVLAPAVRRLRRDGGARVQALGGGSSHATAERLARLAGRSLER